MKLEINRGIGVTHALLRDAHGRPVESAIAPTEAEAVALVRMRYANRRMVRALLVLAAVVLIVGGVLVW